MSKISLFNSKTSKQDLITYNGEYMLDGICIKATITEELNGEYSLNAIFVINKKFNSKCYDLLVEDSLLKVKDEYGEQYFRIASITKTRYDIEVYARHITISDILTMWCEDVRPTKQNGNIALNWIFDNAKGENIFNVSSNISNISSATYQNKNVYEALYTTENCFIERWGGETKRDGFTIQINDRIGEDRGVSVRSRKNLIGFEADTNINELTTRIYPKGYDGITIEEKYIDSPLINNYARIYSREIKFDDIRVNDENYTEGYETLAQAQEEIKRRCNELYEVKKIDIINASYRINFIELSKTEEYKNYSILERTWIGDTINVIEENLGIDIKVRVIKREYDVLRDERINTELSNKDTKIKPPTIADIVAELDKIPNTNDILEQAKENASALIQAGLKNSHVIVKRNEILIMDTDDINTAKKVWRWNVNGLGYSSTGYNGQYGTAMTIDGQIVADFITTGILNANLIKAGMLQSTDGSSFINLETGDAQITGTLKSITRNQFVSLDSGGITFQDWNRKEQMLRMVITSFSEHRDYNGISVSMPKFSDFIRFQYVNKEDLTNGWDSSNTTYNFFDLWSEERNVNGRIFKKGMNVYSPIYTENNLYFKNSEGAFSEIVREMSLNPVGTGNVKGLMGLFGDNGIILGYKSGSQYKTRMVMSETSFPGTGDNIATWGNINLNGGTIHNGTFNGRVINSYSDTSLKTFAMTRTIESEEQQIRFIYENISIENNKTILNIPNRYKGIKNGYIISSIVKKAKGDVWVSEEQENRFILEADTDMIVNVEIIIKIRNQEFTINDNTIK